MGHGQGLVSEPGDERTAGWASGSAMPRTVRRIVREELEPLIELADEIRKMLRAERRSDGDQLVPRGPEDDAQ